MKGEPISLLPGVKNSVERLSFTGRQVASVKMDGIRLLVQDAGSRCWSGQIKELPNKHLHKLVEQLPAGVEAEVMAVYQNGFNHPMTGRHYVFKHLQSAVMRESGEPNYVIYLFDNWAMWRAPFEERLQSLNDIMVRHGLDPIKFRPLNNTYVKDATHVRDLTYQVIESGYEGLIIKDLDATYKFGRSTFDEQIMLKVKPMQDMEGTVIGFEQLVNKFGVAQPLLGALIVEAKPRFSNTFNIGSGFTQEERRLMWLMRYTLPYQQVTFKYQESGSTDEAPRSPIFKAIRNAVV